MLQFGCNQPLQRREFMNRRSDEVEFRRLMMAGLDGDEIAYKALLVRLCGHLRAHFRRRLARFDRGPTEAEDLLQETVLAVHTHRNTYDRSQLFTPWLHAIARYKLLDYLRRTNASIRDEPIEDMEEILAHDDREAVESRLDVAKLLDALPSKARRAIQYVKLDGLSVSEAAARMGMSESAIKVSVHRGLRALARFIGKRRTAS